ncbi:universal stress protein [Roseateles cellulosilyticus]|uniref:Universal stress protein n=1 Tax=Pelomonas cellulosilytica TaxID=2906762 RepID=A0ABS8Y1G1_9BURK|nr:universal stress protein [Pelomonas sp. P8]MCE4556746.1 universal stress protein [Pelomonas sp. P8]
MAVIVASGHRRSFERRQPNALIQRKAGSTGGAQHRRTTREQGTDMGAVFKHVLVATDGSVLADAALALAHRLGHDGRVTALLVAKDYGLAGYVKAAVQGHPDARQLREDIVAEGGRQLAAAIERAIGADVAIERRVVLSDQAPCHEIIATANREGCDLIIMASHGLGGRLAGVVGSQCQAVLAMASVPVLVAR